MEKVGQQILDGKRELANALNFCHVDAYPNASNTDKYEDFSSYVQKIGTLKVEDETKQ